MTRGSSLAQDAVHRELAALIDGPWALRWYWRDDLEAMQLACQRTGHPDRHPGAVLRAYQPCDRWIGHPTEPDVPGRTWRHIPTADDAAGSAA